MLFVWLSAALAQNHPPGAVISDAVAVHLTPEGLESVGALVGAFLPSDPIAVDPISVGGSCLGADITNVLVGVEVVNTSVLPSQGTLTIALDALINVNDPANPMGIDYEIACFGGGCPGYVDPFLMTINLIVGLSVDANGDLDAVVSPLTPSDFTNALADDDIHLDCAIDTINEVLSVIGLSIYDQIINIANDFLIDELNNQIPAIEIAIEEAFSAASIDQSVELLPGVNLDIYLAPQAIDITPAGIRLLMEGSMSSPAAECITALDPGASAGTPGGPPALAAEPPGSQIVVHASDDLVNQALYSVWRSGLLCQEIAGGDLGGFAIDTSLLGLIGGEPYQELFPGIAPMTIETVPRKVLEAEFGGAHDLDVPLEQFEVLFYAELDGRVARALGVELNTNVGIDLSFDDTAGELAVAVDIDPNFQAELTGDIMVPGHEEAVLENVVGVLGALLDTALGGLLGDALAFTLPVLDGGVGLTALDAAPTGGGEWLGLYAELGPVTYTGTSCSDGCGGAGGGCASSGGSAFGFATLMVLFMRRRR